MKNISYNRGYDAGVKIACAAANVNPEDVLRSNAFSERFLADNFIQHNICKMAATAFKEAGMEGTLECSLYNRMAKEAAYRSLSNYVVEEFIVPVVKALHKEARLVREEAFDSMTKDASALSFLSQTAGKALASIPSIAHNVLVLSALGGAGVGSLAWALNRDSDTDSSETDEKHAQAMHYKRIAEDLKKRLGDNIALNKAVKKNVEETSEGAYLL